MNVRAVIEMVEWGEACLALEVEEEDCGSHCQDGLRHSRSFVEDYEVSMLI